MPCRERGMQWLFFRSRVALFVSYLLILNMMSRPRQNFILYCTNWLLIVCLLNGVMSMDCCYTRDECIFIHPRVLLLELYPCGMMLLTKGFRRLFVELRQIS